MEAQEAPVYSWSLFPNPKRQPATELYAFVVFFFFLLPFSHGLLVLLKAHSSICLFFLP